MTDRPYFQQNTVTEQLLMTSICFCNVLHYCILTNINLLDHACISIYTSCMCVCVGGIYYEVKYLSYIISGIEIHGISKH